MKINMLIKKIYCEFTKDEQYVYCNEEVFEIADVKSFEIINSN
jgi:hypothetical protein